MVHFEVHWEIIFPRYRSATRCWTGKGNIGGGIVRFGNTCSLIGEATVSWTCCLPAIHLKVGCRAFEYKNALRERLKAEPTGLILRLDRLIWAARPLNVVHMSAEPPAVIRPGWTALRNSGHGFTSLTESYLSTPFSNWAYYLSKLQTVIN